MKILVPTDFSEYAEYGLNVAIKLAEVLNAEIFLLNLLEPPQGTTFTVTGDVTKNNDSEEDRYVAELYRVNSAKLKGIADRQGNIQITPVVRVENLQEGVKNFMDGHRVDLVVMGTSGESTFTEYFIGNHTEQVIRISHVPVLTVKRDHPTLMIRNIALATDLDDASTIGITQLSRLALAFNAKIHVVHVLKNDKRSQAKVLSQLEEFAKKHGLVNYSINVINDDEETDGIRDYARKSGADIIAVMTHARTGLSNILMGSVSETLVREADVPVLTVNLED